MLALQDFCIESDRTILDALVKIDKNAHGVAFVIDNHRFMGVLTDGDLRRALIAGADKADCISAWYNQDAISLSVETPDSEIQRVLSSRVKVVPLLDDRGVVVDYASFFRLHRYPVMEPKMAGNEMEYVSDCIRTNWISSQGRYVSKFEEHVCTESNSKYSLATSNGTVSLHLAMLALGIGSGDEVIVPNFTFGASVSSIIHAGAEPVLVDVDSDTWNISAKAVEEAISVRTKAIMVVHLYGNPCDMGEILTLAQAKNLLIIEDCAEALGAKVNGQSVGGIGDAGAFSFFANKIITCGEGGAVTFQKERMLQNATKLRDHGMLKDKRYWHDVVGYNYRMTNLQAAIGCAQFEQLGSFNEKRKDIFELYDSLLLPSGLFVRQTVRRESQNSNWLYTVLLSKEATISRDDLIERLRLCGVDTRPTFYPMNKMPAFKAARTSGSLAVSEDISGRGLSLPSSLSLELDHVATICERVLSVMNNKI